MLYRHRKPSKMGFFGGAVLCFITNCAFTSYYNDQCRRNKEPIQWRPPLASAAVSISPSSKASLNSGDSDINRRDTLVSPPEWEALPSGSQDRLSELLSWESLSKFDFEYVFEVDELTNGHSLFFISWAVINSPQAQQVMQIDASPEKGYHFMDSFDLDPFNFLDFVRRIEDQYKDNPYHNSIHAADVVQTTHAFVQSLEDTSRSQYSDLQLLSILLAAIVHDVGHDGTSNEFHVQTKSSIAQRYKNESVLEKYHIQEGLRQIENSGLLDHFPENTQHQIHEMIQDAILHTDMTLHKKQVEACEERIQGIEQENSVWKSLVYLMHLADISNSAKPTFRKWTDNVMEEFFQQGDRQRYLNMEISPLHDRAKVDVVKSQYGFVKFVVLPAFVAVPFADDRIVERLQTNLEYWQSRIESDQSR